MPISTISYDERLSSPISPDDRIVGERAGALPLPVPPLADVALAVRVEARAHPVPPAPQPRALVHLAHPVGRRRAHQPPLARWLVGHPPALVRAPRLGRTALAGLGAEGWRRQGRSYI